MSGSCFLSRSQEEKLTWMKVSHLTFELSDGVIDLISPCMVVSVDATFHILLLIIIVLILGRSIP